MSEDEKHIEDLIACLDRVRDMIEDAIGEIENLYPANGIKKLNEAIKDIDRNI